MRYLQKPLACMLIALLIITTITAGIKIPINDDPLEIPEEVDPATAKSLREINRYAQQSMPSKDGSRGSINIEDEHVTITDSNGKQFARFPKEMKVINKDNDLTFSWEGFGGKLLGPIEIDGMKAGQINSIAETEVRYSKEKGIRKLEVPKGIAAIGAGNAKSLSSTETTRFWNENGYNFAGIQDAVIEIDENDEVRFANFESIYGGEFQFDYKGQSYNFKTEDIRSRGGAKKARVIFDPNNNVVSGENTEITYSKTDKNGKPGNTFTIDGKFDITIDENGDPTAILITQGSYRAEGLFGEYKTEFFATNDKPLSVFLDGREIKDHKGNAISIDEENRKILMKGQLKGLGVNKRVNYEGLSDNAYTEMHHDGIEKGENKKDGIAYFDVQEGEANIDNGKNLVNIKDGVARIKVKGQGGGAPTSFKFGAHGVDGLTEGFVDEDGNPPKFIVKTYDSSGKLFGKPLEISLSTLTSSFSESVSELVIRTTNRNFIDQEIGKIATKLRSADLTPKEKNSLEFQRILLENEAGKIEGTDLEASTKRIKDFIKTNPDPEVRAIANTALGELYLETIARDRPSYGSARAKILSDNAVESFQATKDYAEEQLNYGPLTEETRNRLRFLEEQSRLNIGKSRLYTQRAIGEYDFFQLTTRGTSPEIRSEANRLLGMSRLAQNPAVNVKYALEKLQISINENPRNEIASQNLRSLQLSLINSRQSQFANEGLRNLKDLEYLTGDGGFADGFNRFMSPVESYYYQITKWTDEALGVRTEDAGRLNQLIRQGERQIDEIDIRRVGSRGMERLISGNVDLNNYMTSDFTSKFGSVMTSHNLDTHLSAEEFQRYSSELELSYSEQTIARDRARLYDAIAKDKGKSVADSFRSSFERVSATMGSIDHAINIDPMLHLIAGSGNEIKIGSQSQYFGSQELETAFTLDRAGEPLERTWAEAISLETGDFVLSTIATAGTGWLIARGAGATAQAINLGTRTTAAIGSIGHIFSPATAASLKLLGQAAPKTALALGIGADIGIGIATLGAIPAEAAAVYEIASIVLPAGQAKRQISRIVNEAGDVRTFMHAVDEQEIASLGESLTSKGAQLRSDLGSNIFEIDGEILEIGTEIGEGFKSVKTQNVQPIQEYEGFKDPLDRDPRDHVSRYNQIKKSDTAVEFSGSAKNVDSEGRILTQSGKKLDEGTYIWVVDQDGNMRTSSIEGEGILPTHGDLALGKKVQSAGEFNIDANGKITEVSPTAKAYLSRDEFGDLISDEFDEQARIVFREHARINGIDVNEATWVSEVSDLTESQSQSIRNAQQNLAETVEPRPPTQKELLDREIKNTWGVVPGAQGDDVLSIQYPDFVAAATGNSADQVRFNLMKAGAAAGLEPSDLALLNRFIDDFAEGGILIKPIADAELVFPRNTRINQNSVRENTRLYNEHLARTIEDFRTQGVSIDSIITAERDMDIFATSINRNPNLPDARRTILTRDHFGGEETNIYKSMVSALQQAKAESLKIPEGPARILGFEAAAKRNMNLVINNNLDQSLRIYNRNVAPHLPNEGNILFTDVGRRGTMQFWQAAMFERTQPGRNGFVSLAYTSPGNSPNSFRGFIRTTEFPDDWSRSQEGRFFGSITGERTSRLLVPTTERDGTRAVRRIEPGNLDDVQNFAEAVLRHSSVDIIIIFLEQLSLHLDDGN